MSITIRPMPLRSSAWRGVALAAFTLAGCSAALAHDAYFETDAPGHAIVRFADDGKALSYPAAKLTNVRAYDDAGKTLEVKQEAGDGPIGIGVPPDAALLALEFDNGFYSRTTSGTIEKPMNEAPGAVSGIWAKKTAKYVLNWSETVRQPVGMEMEIVPQADAVPRAGDQLMVRVLWDGKPVQGVKVSASEQASGATTDAQGMAAFSVQPGRNFVRAERRIRVANDPRHDSLSVATNLVFVAK